MVDKILSYPTAVISDRSSWLSSDDEDYRLTAAGRCCALLLLQTLAIAGWRSLAIWLAMAGHGWPSLAIMMVGHGWPPGRRLLGCWG